MFLFTSDDTIDENEFEYNDENYEGLNESINDEDNADVYAIQQSEIGNAFNQRNDINSSAYNYNNIKTIQTNNDDDDDDDEINDVKMVVTIVAGFPSGI